MKRFLVTGCTTTRPYLGLPNSTCEMVKMLNFMSQLLKTRKGKKKKKKKKVGKVKGLGRAVAWGRAWTSGEVRWKLGTLNKS